MTKPVGWSDVATEVTDSSPLLLSFGGAFFNNSLYTSNSGRITVELVERRLLLVNLKIREDEGLLVW